MFVSVDGVCSLFGVFEIMTDHDCGWSGQLSSAQLGLIPFKRRE